MAMLCGARSVYAMSQWGKDQDPAMVQALGFPQAETPHQTTLHRTWQALDHGAFERVLGAWMRRHGWDPDEALALDGKQLRGWHGEEMPGVHLVALLGHRSGVVGAQEAVGQGSELAAWRRLQALVPLEGRLVTGDAQFAQREDCEAVVSRGGPISGG